MYAIVEISGKQYKVQEGDIVFVDSIFLLCYTFGINFFKEADYENCERLSGKIRY